MPRITRDPLLDTLAAVATIGIVLALVKLAAPVLNPILLGFFIAALVHPLFRRLKATLERRTIALLAVVGVITLGAVGLVLLLLLSAHTLQSDLERYSTQIAQHVAPLTNPSALIPLPNSTTETLSNLLSDMLGKIAGAVLGGMGDLLFGVVLAALLLLQADRFAQLIFTDLRERPVLGVMPEVMRTVVMYFGIRTRLNVLTGLGMTLFLVLLGIDHAPLWGLLVFLLSYVPYIGLIVAMAPPVLLALAEHGWAAAGLCILAAIVVNLGIENVVEPSYTAQQLRLAPAVVFIAFFVFVWLLGPIGAALAMPLTVMIVLVCKQHPSSQWFATLLTG